MTPPPCLFVVKTFLTTQSALLRKAKSTDLPVPELSYYSYNSLSLLKTELRLYLSQFIDFELSITMFFHDRSEALLAQFPQDNKGRAFIFVGGFFVLYTAYWIGVIIYRLTWHPLARFPGPFLCRIGYFQQMYYEAILNGRFLERLPVLHKRYGNSRDLSSSGRQRAH